MITIDVDYIGSKEDAKHESQMFDIIIHPVEGSSMAWVKGSKKKVFNWLRDVHCLSEDDIEELYDLVY